MSLEGPLRDVQARRDLFVCRPLDQKLDAANDLIDTWNRRIQLLPFFRQHYSTRKRALARPRIP